MEPLASAALHCARAGAGGAPGAGAFTAAATSNCGVNEMPPWAIDVAGQRIEGIDGQRREDPVGMREGRSSRNRHRRTLLDEAARQTCKTDSWHTSNLFNPLGRIVRQPFIPSGQQPNGAGRRAEREELLGHDEMRQAQGKNPFGARPDGHPLVGICTGLRHAGFDLHERSAYAGSTAAHLTVADALRHRRIPCAEEISAEAEDVPGVGEIKRWQLLASEAQRIRTAQHFVTEQLVA